VTDCQQDIGLGICWNSGVSTFPGLKWSSVLFSRSWQVVDFYCHDKVMASMGTGKSERDGSISTGIGDFGAADKTVLT
jgi:hypothetical protein